MHLIICEVHSPFINDYLIFNLEFVGLKCMCQERSGCAATGVEKDCGDDVCFNSTFSWDAAKIERGCLSRNQINKINMA